MSAERQRLQRLLHRSTPTTTVSPPPTRSLRTWPTGADRRTSEETDEAVARQLHQCMQALQRAEGRLAAGTYRPLSPERPGQSPTSG